MTWDPGRDREGLEQALLELMEEGLAFRRLEQKLDSADDSTRERLARMMPDRELSPGYYMLGDYLIWLDQRVEKMKAGLVDAAAFEVDGLCILAQAREKHDREHPFCPHCGERQDNRFWQRCFDCGFEVKR